MPLLRTHPTSTLLRGLALAALLGGCGGGREPPSAQPLPAPEASLADAGRCSDDAPQRGLIGHRHDGAVCRKSFRGLAAGGGSGNTAGAAVATPRRLTIAELFDWAEVQYREYFPSRRQNQTLFPYVYRYYPESGNHVAVAGDQIYVQGPISGGALLYVGTLSEFVCLVAPGACAGIRPCTAPASWAVGASICSPGSDQPRQLASGASYTFTDTSGTTSGSATYACTDGNLALRTDAVCETTPPRDCNTQGLSWSSGAASCKPNASEPTQLAHGQTRSFTSSVDAVGSASYRCDNGLLVAQGAASCTAAGNTACKPGASIEWTVEGRRCSADFIPAQVAAGARYRFVDSSLPLIGEAGGVCAGGSLQLEPGAACSDEVRVADSFGGDGGAADGGASGDGTAADGAPIVGGLVRVVDLNGRRASATTDPQGYFRVRLTGMTPPLLVSVTRPDGKVRRSLSLRPLRANGYVFIAVTGLTDKIVSDLAAAAGFSSPAAVTPAVADRARSAVDAAITALRNHPTVRARLVAAGVDPATFDPIHTPFRADGRGYDAVLDNLLIDSDDTGATVVRSADCTTPLSWTVEQHTCTPDAAEPTVIASGSAVVVRDTQGSTRGAVGWSCNKGVLSKPLLASCGPGP